MHSTTFYAPAKINLCLTILGIRDDGYHDIQSIMRPISLYDELLFQRIEKSEINLKCSPPLIPNKDNLVIKAANLLLHGKNKTPGYPGYEIKLKKNIPIAAGLGGGSSDAASTLLALNKLYDINLSKDQLKEIGISIGADVPFFIEARSSLAEGKGEKLTPLDDLPTWWFLLVNPGFKVSTKWTYKNLNLNLTKQKDMIKMTALLPSLKDVIKIKHLLINDLEVPVIAKYPQIRKLKKIVYSLEAEVVGMSGSGPTVFGLYTDYKKAKQAFSYCFNKNYWTALVKTIN